ncbi:MAG: S8 family serine peptidase [Armatimonadota bacterium]|nr:S8 family serine peptidase [Armatimonadota bacterium]
MSLNWPKAPALLLLVAATFLVVSVSAAADPKPSLHKLDSSLALLYSMHKQYQRLLSYDAGPHADANGVNGTIVCRRPLTSAEEAYLSQLGVHSNRKLHLPGGGPARIPWSAIEKLSELDFVDFIDSDWHPSVLPCLDISAQETGAVAAWSRLTPTGQPTTGQGVVIADFDTGVDVFHPGLWRADGPDYNWIDANSNGLFDKGIDAVDLNGNGSADGGELLNYLKGSAKDYKGTVTNGSGAFVASQDWLFNDANGSGARDFGVGFGESTPVYGERVFVVQDSNHNSALDLGETLVALGSCKIAAVMGAGGVTRVRGVNLISSPADTAGHGTSVCGIICGETPGLRKFVGLASGAEMIVADRFANSYTSYIPWAEQRGARVMLYEFGGWTYQFMDGSSPLEQMIDDESAKGIVQIAPAGNLANVKKHARVSAPSGATRDITVNVPVGRGITSVYLSVIWTNRTNAAAVRLVNPSGLIYDLPGDATFRSDSSGNLYWSNGILQSALYTRRFDINIARASGVTTGYWKIRVTNNSGSPIVFHAYVSDNLNVWSGGTIFQDNVDTNYTTTWPATARSALVAGSYSTRGIYVKSGDLSLYSSEGPSISTSDYTVDLCAPGNSDVFALCSKDADNPFGTYKAFGGTSSAAAHVAAAAALVLQTNPALDPDQVDELIYGSALADNFTGQVPDVAWGYGKLNVLPAVENAASPALESPRHLKERNPDGATVRMWGKIVVATGNDGAKYCYIEERNRTSGIKIVGYSGQVSEGDNIEVTGTLATVNGERQINASSIRILMKQQSPPPPMALNAAALGGSDCPGTPGISGGYGLNNIGLLVTTFGTVTSITTNRFYLNGGTASEIGVAANGFTPPPAGKFVAVTGMSSVEIRDGLPKSLVRPRRQTDVIVLN